MLVNNALFWERNGHVVSLREGEDKGLSFCLDPAESKSFLHPLRAPGQRTVLTDCYPADHIWHRGVWWSWKFINDVNYWEENAQHTSEGLTRMDESEVLIHGARVEIDLRLTYLPPDGEAVLKEQRHIDADASDPSMHVVDYSFQFVALKDCVLRATPVGGEPEGKPYGGYAGFSVRRSPATGTWTHLDSEGRRTVADIHGQTARWILASGPVPDGESSLAVLSHPSNPRSPSKWYVYEGGLPFFSPALLMGGALVVRKDQAFSCCYRLLVAARILSTEDVEAAYRSFIPTGVSPIPTGVSP
jgi:hypothetical protein